MNPGKIVGKYHRALVINPVIAVILATLVLSANRIVPIIVNIFNGDLANQLRESVELTSVYGVALGTLFVFPSSWRIIRIKSYQHISKTGERVRRMNSNQVI